MARDRQRRRMLPAALIGALLLLGGCWWIGVARSVITREVSSTATGASGPGSMAVSPASPASSTATANDFAARIIARTNLYRTQNGCPALAPNPTLMSTAQQHSADMAAHDFVGHDSSAGVNIGDRIKAAGYTYSLVAENIAWGQQTPEQVVDMWFNESPPNDLHRKNILNCSLHDIGAGYVYLASDPGNVTAHSYWTEDFGTRLGS
jgi:uncharacterized protein YkwD